MLVPLFADAGRRGCTPSSPSAAPICAATRARSRSRAGAATTARRCSRPRCARPSRRSGCRPSDVDVLGALAPVGTFVTNYAIYPFVGLIEHGFEWIAQEAEVAEVLEFALEDLVAGHSLKRLVRRGMAFRTDVYEIGPHMVWGATARDPRRPASHA